MRTRRHKLQVSTFPFLAVLLCAMGALLLVLLVMDRRAHYAARARAEQALRSAAEETVAATAVEARRQEARAARQRERDAAHAGLVNQESELQKQIQAVRDELARAAGRLRAEQDSEGALKQKIEAEHARAAEEEKGLAYARAEDAKAAAQAAQSEASRKALEEMTAGLERLEQKLADLKAARQKEEKTYSVVPYNGKRGEDRRPVYVECAAGQVIFHPDRTPLTEPLNAPTVQAEVAQRVARQKEQLPADQAASYTPYLMLLVRPDGVSTYYRFREALQGLKIDFGYEFVDQDWVLNFPTDDQETAAPLWRTAAKPVVTDPPAPPSGASAARLHGVAPVPDAEDGPGLARPVEGSPNLPDLLPPPAVGTANTAVSGGPSGANANLTQAGPVGTVAGGPPHSPTQEEPQVGALAAPPTTTPAGPGSIAGSMGAAPAGKSGPKHSSSSGSWATQGTQAAPDSAGPSPPPVPGPNQGAASAPGTVAAAKAPPATPPGATAGKTGGDKTTAAGNADDDPFLRAPPTPPTKALHPAALRPARLSGDRDWIIYVECKLEGVVIYPTQTLVPLAALKHPTAGNQLPQTIQQLIDRKQATVRAGEMPYRPEVRFLVRPEAARTYHLAYPTLDALSAAKTSQILGPDDDVSAIVAGH